MYCRRQIIAIRGSFVSVREIEMHVFGFHDNSSPDVSFLQFFPTISSTSFIEMSGGKMSRKEYESKCVRSSFVV